MELARLRALPGVAAAHEQAAAWHKARFAKLITTEEGHRLYSQLLLSAGSATPSSEDAKQMVDWFQKAYRRSLSL